MYVLYRVKNGASMLNISPYVNNVKTRHIGCRLYVPAENTSLGHWRIVANRWGGDVIRTFYNGF